MYKKCSFFESLFAPVIEELNEGDRRRGSRYMIMSLKAQINSLKLVMNKAYLIFMNVTLYKEVISKHISHSASQFVLVALTRAGMVHTNKVLLELIFTRKDFIRRQKINADKQKESDLNKRLNQMQKSTDTQLDEKVNDKVDQTVHRAVREILTEDLNTKAFKKPKRRKSLNTSVSDGTKEGVSVSSENVKSTETVNQSTVMGNANPTMPIPMTQTFVDANGNQFMMMPISTGQAFPVMQTATTSGQMNFSSGSRGGRFRGRGRGYGGRFSRGSTKHSGIFDAYCMNSAPLNIFENQVIPTGLHDVSKSFRPNLATTRVFSMGTKFIPVWKKTKYISLFLTFKTSVEE